MGSCSARRWLAAVLLLLAPGLVVLLGTNGVARGDESSAVQPQHDPLFDEVGGGADAPAGFPDPLEGMNRSLLRFNEELDRWVLDPFTRIYRFLVPSPVKRSLRNAVANVNSPVILANDVFQLELHDAGITLWRFVINSTVGIGGLIDIGDLLNVPRHSSDFDQTLAIYGVPSGPFLVLPILGPNTVRSSAGMVVDLLFRPTVYFLGPAEQLTFTIIQGGSSGLALREAAFDQIRALHESSVDYYASLRNAYYQNRMAEIWGRRRAREAQAQARVVSEPRP